MQQGGGSHSYQYNILGGGSSTSAAAGDQTHHHQQHQMVVEEASPISSRPPATATLDDFGHGRNFPDMDAAIAASGDDPDRGGGSSGGNRWPRQETLALLKIRAEMDATFRDAIVKGPLWDDVSRKMADLGFKRSAKKCKEKFENVDKYYKRTKEGRAGRQDGKTYKFFTELEALHSTTTSSSSAIPPPPFTTTSIPDTAAPSNLIGIGFSNPTPISSVRPLPTQQHVFPVAVAPPPAAASSPMGMDFSSNSSSSSPETEDDEDNDEGTDLEGNSRKRKRESGSSSKRMMVFFEGLVKQVMQKQETMQQKFLEAIEKREQGRLMREEAWRRQEMARLAREHEIMSQERAVSASRDASILAFLHKVTGQTVQLPPPLPVASIPTTTATTPVPPPATPIPLAVPSAQLYPQPPHQFSATMEVALAAVPEQQVRVHENIGGGSGRGSEPPSASRWPKVEVLALIKLRSELESKYQEAGPKGPLWEEISARMQRMGYRRSPKRCKEKWENINKYFKKVKESNKKRPEDAKTCPYFQELDALYRKKILAGGGCSMGGEGGSISSQQQQTVDAPEPPPKNGGGSGGGGQVAAAGEGNGGENKKPEDIVKEFIGLGQQQRGLNLSESNQNPMLNFSELRVLGHGGNNGGHQLGVEDDSDDGIDEDEEDEDEELEEGRKMAYEIEIQQRRQNASVPTNGGRSGAAASFLAMVQ